MGRLHGADRGRGGQPETIANLDRAGSDGGGGTPRQLTHDGEANQRARWSPDSKRIAYISDRGGSSQIWLMDPDGGNARQITNLSTEADGVTVLARWQEPGLHQRRLSRVRRRRCLQQEELWTPRRPARCSAHLHRTALPALDRLAGRAPQPSAGGSGGGRRGPGPDARAARRAAVFAGRSRRLRHLARRPGSLLLHECRPGAGHQHQLRSVRGLHQGRRAAQNHLHSGRPIPARTIRPTASTSPGARSSAPATRATAGACWCWSAPPAG